MESVAPDLRDFDALLSPENLTAPPVIPTEKEKQQKEKVPKRRGRPPKPKTPTPSEADKERDLFFNKLINEPLEMDEEKADEEEEEERPKKGKSRNRVPKSSTPVRASALKSSYVERILAYQSEDKYNIIEHFEKEELLDMPDEEVAALFDDWKSQKGKVSVVKAFQTIIMSFLPGLERYNAYCLEKKAAGKEELGKIESYAASVNIAYPLSLTKELKENELFQESLEVVLMKYLPVDGSGIMPAELMLGFSFASVFGSVTSLNAATASHLQQKQENVQFKAPDYVIP